MASVSPPRKPLELHSMPGRIRQGPPASYETGLPPAFPPPDAECSSCSIGPPDPHTPSDDRELGRSSPRLCFSPTLVAARFFGSSFSFSFPTSSASTSFVSRRIGPRGFARFVVGFVGSLFFPELLSLFKVDLLIHCDCT